MVIEQATEVYARRLAPCELLVLIVHQVIEQAGLAAVHTHSKAALFPVFREGDLPVTGVFIHAFSPDLIEGGLVDP